ncbi:MAG: MATE family efflux transporter [Christensenellaceae bacterium]|nr:MATE family efflux transporter [Christensenellaceae bacterium]
MNGLNGKSMTEGAPWKHILRFALPVLAGSLLQQLYNTVDSIVVGNFSGEAALSAVGTTGSFAFLFLALATGFSAGNGVLVAQHYGAGDEKQVRAYASTGILLMMGMGLLSAVAGFAVARPAYTHLVAVPEEFLELTLQYFRIYALGLIFQFGYNIFSSILRAVGDSAATLYFLLIASVSNVLLDLLFVAGFRWGVIGAALATNIAQAGSFVAAYIYMTRKYPMFRFGLKSFTWDGSLAKRTLTTGFPIALQLIIVSFGLTFIQRAVNGFGQTMTASFTVGYRIELYMNLPCNAFQTTLATYTGQNIGAGKPERVKRGARQAILMSFLMTLCISTLVWLFTARIISLFGLSDQAAIYCNAHIRTIALINVIMSVYIPLFGVFQGTKHGGAATVVAVGALGMRVLSTYLFRYSSLFGHTIIWWNGLFGFGTGLIITWTYYLSGRWQRGAVLERQAAPGMERGGDSL